METEKQRRGGGATPSIVPPFLNKCYDMVDDPSTDETVSWSHTNNSFVIWDQHAFARDLLSKYFKHSNLSSFVRQLNTYGFHKVDPDRYEFASEGFLRGQKHLLKTITRRKTTQSTPQPLPSKEKNPSVKACIEAGKFKQEEDITMLKRDKNLLMQELVKLRQHHQNTNHQIHNLRQSLQVMEQNQQQMLSFLAMAVQSPGFLAQLVQQNGNARWTAEANKKRRFPALDLEPPVDGQIVTYQPIRTETLLPGVMPILDDDVGSVPSMPGVMPILDDDVGSVPSMPGVMPILDDDVGSVLFMPGDSNDLCTVVDAMSLEEDSYLAEDGHFPMVDFSDFDLEQLLASPFPGDIGNMDSAMFDYTMDLGLPEQEIQMETS